MNPQIDRRRFLQVGGLAVAGAVAPVFSVRSSLNEGMRKGFDFPLGQGSIDWGKVREELNKIGFGSWATAEVRGGDRQRLAEISQQMDHVLGL